jgi:pimeloyl-ACP methyl ester carboxylesterase
MSLRLLALTAAGAATAGFALATRQAARQAERARPAPGRFLTIDGVRLHYLDQGVGGPPVLLLHGNGSMVEDFASSGLIGMLAAQRRVVALDRPGFGRSERPRDRRWTPEAQAAVIAQAIRRLGLDRPVVVGHSFGTLVAMALALDHPEVLRGVVLVGGYFFPTARVDVPLFSPPAIPVIGDVMRYTISPPLGRAMAGPLLRRMFAPRRIPARFEAEFPLPMTLRPWQIRALAEDTAMMVPAAARHSRRHAELRMPVAIVAGADDQIVSTAWQSRGLKKALPGSVLTVIEGAGHMVHHAAPEVVAEAIKQATTATTPAQPAEVAAG